MTNQEIKSRVKTLETLSYQLLQGISNPHENTGSREYLAKQINKGLQELNNQIKE